MTFWGWAFQAMRIVCKGPEAGRALGDFRKRKKANVAVAQSASWGRLGSGQSVP